ncbi:MAG TPA: cobyric acid synthase, partial [Trebonia sp.]|nr:cobyric acid synthase [Trebonia sp.]
MNAILVAGTTSDAGKSVLTAGICRHLARQGLSVAPFKAQNMSLNSYVTADGCEIGRAQAMQAAAARVEPTGAMNPVLLKPGARGSSQVMLLGQPVAEADALSYAELKPRLRPAILDCLADLRRRHDAVICEGAGSPAEINLRDGDLANMGLARAAGLPVLVTGDIDRGGVFAAMFGTLALLSAGDQALVAGWVVNKFRGDARLLAPGLDLLRRLTGRPVLGVLPMISGLWVDTEDSLGLANRAQSAGPGQAGQGQAGPGRAGAAAGGDALRVAVVRLPRISNFTDADPLAAEPSVVVGYA